MTKRKVESCSYCNMTKGKHEETCVAQKFCSKCGLNFAEYMACEEPDCGTLVSSKETA